MKVTLFNCALVAVLVVQTPTTNAIVIMEAKKNELSKVPTSLNQASASTEMATETATNSNIEAPLHTMTDAEAEARVNSELTAEAATEAQNQA